jgi:hypothetical protein
MIDNHMIKSFDTIPQYAAQAVLHSLGHLQQDQQASAADIHVSQNNLDMNRSHQKTTKTSVHRPEIHRQKISIRIRSIEWNSVESLFNNY